MTSAKVCENCLSGAKPCLGHPCALTPPTPDPRERGETRDVKAEHQAQTRIMAAVLGISAPAPSEAVAWQLVHTRTGQRWTPATDRASVENQQREFAALGATETRIAALVDHHPAPARGVTEEEREVMGDIALDGFIDWCDLDPTDENRSASALARQYLALRQKSRTPDAEGGA